MSDGDKVRKINNRERMKQIHDHTGIKMVRNITPTDIDGYTDLNGNAFIFLEGKTAGTKMEKAQEKAFERLAYSITVPCYVMVYEHETEAHEDVRTHECRVIKYCTNETEPLSWRTCEETVQSAIDKLYAHWKDKGIDV